METTLKEVARLAQTSPSTASKVLNGRNSPVRIKETTRNRILQVAADLGFRPNPVARSLRMQRTETLGVVVRGLDSAIRRVDRAEQLASEHGFRLILSVNRSQRRQDEREREQMEIDRLLHRKVDGLLLLSPTVEPGPRPTLQRLADEKFPLVSVGPVLIKGIDIVDWNRVEAYQRLTEHLLSRGCRKFVFLAVHLTPAVQQRIDGIREALALVPDAEMRIAQPDVSVEEMDTIHTQDLVASALTPLFRDGWPHAVVCPTDLLALGALNLARAMGVKCPEQLAIAGCTDSQFAAMLDVPLTTVRMPDEQVVDVAVRRIVHRIENRKNELEPITRLVPAELVLRRSSRFGQSGD